MKFLSLALITLIIVIESVTMIQNSFIMLIQYRLNVKFNDLVYTACKEESKELNEKDNLLWNNFLESMKVMK